jgi:hypothetical protein
MVTELNNFRISETEKRFREYLKQYHPEKYNKLIIVEKENLEDDISVFSPT